MSKLDYKEDMKVDKYNLEIEWERHTQLYLDYMEAEVDAQDIRDRLERRLDLVKAEMDAKVRSNPAKYGIEKVSESAIKSVVTKSTRVQEAQEEYLNAVKRAKKLSGVMKGMEHRKRQLTELDRLFTGGYYSSSRPSTEGISNARQQRQRELLKERMEKIRGR
jgi:hypothetical protein